MRWLDTTILAGYTRVAHAVQVWTGRTSYWLARLCCVWMALTSLSELVGWWWPPMASSGSQTTFDMWMGSLGAVVYLLFGMLFDYNDRQFRASVTAVPRNPFDTKGVRLVFFFCGMLVLWTGIMSPWPEGRTPHRVIHLLAGLASASLPYFATVVPRPPAPSRLRAWARSWRPLPNPVHA